MKTAVLIVLFGLCGCGQVATANSQSHEKYTIFSAYDVFFDDLGECIEYELNNYKTITICDNVIIIER